MIFRISPSDRLGVAVDRLRLVGKSVFIMQKKRRRDGKRRAAALRSTHQNPAGRQSLPRMNRQQGDSSDTPTEALKDHRQSFRAMNENEHPARGDQGQGGGNPISQGLRT